MEHLVRFFELIEQQDAAAATRQELIQCRPCPVSDVAGRSTQQITESANAGFAVSPMVLKFLDNPRRIRELLVE